MYLNMKASAARLREAELARRNRLEIVKALSTGQITRRDLFKWGIFTAGGLLAAKHGLSPYAQSAFAASGVPTGAPRSPLFNARKFDQPMPRLALQPKHRMEHVEGEDDPCAFRNTWGGYERNSKNHSWHDDFIHSAGTEYYNPTTHRGPCEGRPPGDFFAHQHWGQHYPDYGYLLSMGQIRPGSRIHPGHMEQNANSMWTFGARTPGLVHDAAGSRTGHPVPPLIKMRYGEPIVTRIYNDLPVDRAANGGFGRNEISTHFHNAHNGAESDGACNAYHFPGTFYDYHWTTTLARADNPNLWLRSDPNYARKASGPDDDEGLVQVPGDFRELKGTLWFHDHRFFFTAENVYKGNFGMINMYSGPDRGREDLNDGINLQLPSGSLLKWGNVDFDVNLAIANQAFDQSGQLYFDIFDTDGFLGDIITVNGAYYPYMEALPRRYRFRMLNASMSRFIQLAFSVQFSSRFATGTRVPFYFIANDGNFVVSPLKLLQLDEQGVGERYDVVIDFAAFWPGDRIRLANLLQQTNGKKPDGQVSVAAALRGVSADPAVGSILEFRVVSQLQSVDDPTKTYDSAVDLDRSANFENLDWSTRLKTLTKQIPIVAPVRERVIEWNSGSGDSRDTPDGQCVPECGDAQAFPWVVRVNGESTHSLNANRISLLVPKPGDVEHWTYVNGGGGWDHPIHLHFEEGVTINRGQAAIPATERLVRKDVWRLRPSGRVKFQVRFGEFGGAYVNHCHNTVHEDFAMLLRYQVLTPPPNSPDYKGLPHYVPTMTPIPTPDGVVWKQPEILPEATKSSKT
ncbi:MAG: multicopper oxidase family protein [Aestuariivirga sp.]